MSESLLGEWQGCIRAARAKRQSLLLRGGNSKAFYGNAVFARTDVIDQVIDTRRFSGVVTYEPAELILTARAGTALLEIESVLRDNGQMLPFEPPHFSVDQQATLGGCVASGLSGPRRPYAGAVRDHVLGVRLIDGRGERLKFGAEVVKNVAGFDVSRLMVGALGTLGLLTEVTVKVVPQPEVETTLVIDCNGERMIAMLKSLRRQTWPVSATVFIANQLAVRFSGSENVVRSAIRIALGQLGGSVRDDADFWASIRDQRHAFFTNQTGHLWRLSVRADAPWTDLGSPQLVEWSGALRWVYVPLDAPLETASKLLSWASQWGGHASLFRPGSAALLDQPLDAQLNAPTDAQRQERFAPLSATAMRLHQKLKQTFDPDRLFNPGRLYHNL